MQVILDSSFDRPGSAPILGGKKGEFRDWTLQDIAHYRNVTALGRVSYIDWIENLNISAEMFMNEKLPN